jgi:beta-lactamase superfamily II metal-dependent hydrolase
VRSPSLRAWSAGRRLRLVLLLGVLWSLLASAAAPSRAWAAELALTFFDIGQGDAALIVSPTGKRILIDGGPPESGPRLCEALRRQRVDSIDLIVLSHPHMDHLGGLKDVVASLPVRMFLDAAYPSTSPGYTALLRLLQERGVTLTQSILDRTIEIGDGATLRILGPPSPWLTNTRSDVNANSVVVLLSWRGRTVLFTGDAEPETERWLLARAPQGLTALPAELLKVAHHGGRFSSTPAFLQAVRPRIAVISSGAGNDYGHPTGEALGRLAEIGARVLRTDQLGDITLRSRDGQAWQLESRAATAPLAATPAAPSTLVRSAPSAPSAPSAASAFVGSQRTQVFHRADCPAARQIQAANQISFPSREAALAAGRRPAADCHP